jgi:5-formyltetrahydrofolate cyclo-ligase
MGNYVAGVERRMGTTDGMDAPPERHAASSGSASQAKDQLRAQCRELREKLGLAYRDRASERICERIQQWGAFQSAHVIFAYLPMRGEVDLRPLIARSPDIRWAIPRVVDTPIRHLIFHAYQSDRLLAHRYGMLEPDPSVPQIAPHKADLIIVPGMAFTPSGYRLGYGGGYYDRLLVQPGLAPTLGVCYQALLVGEIPHEHHDVPVGNLVTETLGVIPCRAAA